MAPKKRNSIFKDALNRVRGTPTGAKDDGARLLQAAEELRQRNKNALVDIEDVGTKSANEKGPAVQDHEEQPRHVLHDGVELEDMTQQLQQRRSDVMHGASVGEESPLRRASVGDSSSAGAEKRPLLSAEEEERRGRGAAGQRSSGTSPRPKERGSFSEAEGTDAPLLQTEEAVQARRRSLSFEENNGPQKGR